MKMPENKRNVAMQRGLGTLGANFPFALLSMNHIGVGVTQSCCKSGTLHKCMID